MQHVDVAALDPLRRLPRQRGGFVSPQLRPRRGPRAEEISLMRSLAGGPRTVTSGPIGRCVKRDWCRALVVDDGVGADRHSTVLFTLTEMGRALIG